MDTKRDTRDAHAMGKATRGHSEKMAICKSRRAASGGTKLDNILFLGLQNYEKINFFCLSLPVCGIVTALAINASLN